MVLTKEVTIQFAGLKMKNKRAEASWTIEEIMKIVLAVGGIIILILLFVNLYGIFTQKTRIEQARANMEDLSAVINSIKEGGSKDFTMLSPRGWSLTGWPVDEMLPDECKKNKWEKCICLCEYGDSLTGRALEALKRAGIPNTRADFLAKCNTVSVCVEVKAETLEVNSIKILFINIAEKTPIFVDGLVHEGEVLKIKKEKIGENVKLSIEPGK